MKVSKNNIGLFLLLLILASPAALFAEDSMDLFPLDPGTRMFNLYYNNISADTLYADGNKANKDFNLRGDIWLFRGAAWFNVGSIPVMTAFFVPFGHTELNTTVSTPGGDVNVSEASPSGIGDIFADTTWWFIHDKESGLFIGPNFMVTAPTGEYDSDKTLNIGNNRWAFKPGLVFAKVLTSKGTFAQAKISAEFYTKNDEYLAAGYDQEKKVLYQFQGFLTQYLNPKTYASLNYFFDCGGETKIDGVWQNDKTRTHSVQFGISRTIAENVDLLIKYTKDVSVENGPMTDVFGFRLTYTFPPSAT